MKKSYFPTLAALTIVLLTFWVYYAAMPQKISEKELPLSEFSTKRAMEKLAFIAKEPHYTGSENHKLVAEYLITELEKLGLETHVQEGFTLTEWGNLTKSRNILARIKGSENGKALMLLSHYDSAPHTKSLGANDDGVGVVTIMEGIRAFLHNQKQHKNDIIILFSDAEELGLNGAALFVKEHDWAKDVGLVLNFEARGSSGPSYMLMEVNNGNAEVIKNFSQAHPEFPVSNSLMYSIYKLLPNDTDLTVFREFGAIQGFNFAFIDNHFNYHTSQDAIETVKLNTLQHQGTYLGSMLNYFCNTDLDRLNSEEDQVYFNTPVNFITYPFAWNFPMAIIFSVLFLAFIFIGIGKKTLDPIIILKGFLPFLFSIFISGGIGFLGWELLKNIYPEYTEMLHGFTYNGHSYIFAFVFLALAVCFISYKNIRNESDTMNYAVAPIFVWLLINFTVAVYLPGGGFFILPVVALILSFGYFIITQKSSRYFSLIMTIPAIVIFVPFISTFPIGLGLKMLFGSMILVALTFGLLIPVFGLFTKKRFWSLVMLLFSIGFFVDAHINSGFEKGKGKPNSLLYIVDADENIAVWSTYDNTIDEWTKNYLGENPLRQNPLENFPLFSKYNSRLNYQSTAPYKEIKSPLITFERDTTIADWRHLTIRISPERNVNRYDIFANPAIDFYHLKCNGAKHINQKGNKYNRKGEKLLSYYVVDQIPLILSFTVSKSAQLDLRLLESSFDLLDNPQFSIPKRPDYMIAKPFVLNDAIVIKKKIDPIMTTEKNDETFNVGDETN